VEQRNGTSIPPRNTTKPPPATKIKKGRFTVTKIADTNHVRSVSMPNMPEPIQGTQMRAPVAAQNQQQQQQTGRPMSASQVPQPVPCLYPTGHGVEVQLQPQSHGHGHGHGHGYGQQLQTQMNANVPLGTINSITTMTGVLQAQPQQHQPAQMMHPVGHTVEAQLQQMQISPSLPVNASINGAASNGVSGFNVAQPMPMSMSQQPIVVPIAPSNTGIINPPSTGAKVTKTMNLPSNAAPLGLDRINASIGVAMGGLSSVVPGGMGKMFHFLDQLKLEVVEADKMIKSLQSDTKFLRGKNKELELRCKESDRKCIQEKTAREDVEAKLRKLRKKLKEYDSKSHSAGGSALAPPPPSATPIPQPSTAYAMDSENEESGTSLGVVMHIERQADTTCAIQNKPRENVPGSSQSKSGVMGKTPPISDAPIIGRSANSLSSAPMEASIESLVEASIESLSSHDHALRALDLT